MEKYSGGTDGEVALLFLSPRTPQHNPIKMLWREIKKAISNTYFDGEGEMKERIARLVGEGGIPRIRLLWYMREATCSAEGARPVAPPAPIPSHNRAPVEPPCRKERPRCRLALQNLIPVAFWLSVFHTVQQKEVIVPMSGSEKVLRTASAQGEYCGNSLIRIMINQFANRKHDCRRIMTRHPNH